MSMIPKKGRKSRKSYKRPAVMFAILLTLSLGLIGSAMALWEDSLYINLIAKTGSFDPLFSDLPTNLAVDCPASTDPAARSGSTAANSDQKTITTTITNAVDGDVFTCHFAILNQGTVPFKIAKPAAMPANMVLSDFDTDVDPGEEVSGTLTITCSYGEGADPTPGSFSLPFACTQWNSADLTAGAWTETITWDGTVSRYEEPV